MKWAVIFVVQYNKNVVKSFSEDRQKWIATPTICNKDEVITVYFKDVFLNACIGYAFESKQTDNIVIHRPVFVKFAFNLFFFTHFIVRSENIQFDFSMAVLKWRLQKNSSRPNRRRELKSFSCTMQQPVEPFRRFASRWDLHNLWEKTCFKFINLNIK